MRALPLADGINEGGHYLGPSVLRAPAEQLRWPLFLVINLLTLTLATVTKFPEGVVVGFQIFAWAPN